MSCRSNGQVSRPIVAWRVLVPRSSTSRMPDRGSGQQPSVEALANERRRRLLQPPLNLCVPAGQSRPV